MASYRVICTDQVPVDQPTSHAHIVALGTGTSTTHWTQKWTVPEVIRAMQTGHRFYTVSPSTGKEADVQAVRCPTCNRDAILRSSPDAVTDNNLDNLPRCG